MSGQSANSHVTVQSAAACQLSQVRPCLDPVGRPSFVLSYVGTTAPAQPVHPAQPAWMNSGCSCSGFCLQDQLQPGELTVMRVQCRFLVRECYSQYI
jgi:hypothetical protein